MYHVYVSMNAFMSFKYTYYDVFIFFALVDLDFSSIVASSTYNLMQNAHGALP